MSLNSDELEFDLGGVAKLSAAEGPARSRKVIGCR